MINKAEVDTMSTEKVIDAALAAMMADLRVILKEQSVEVTDNWVFGLREHHLQDAQGKITHTDSQRALSDPKALRDYQLRATKALWNFAVSLRQILAADGLVAKGKLGLSLSDFIAANIQYLDNTHLDEAGQSKPNRAGSFASLVGDSTTLQQLKAIASFYCP
jgi:hypothetical protein